MRSHTYSLCMSRGMPFTFASLSLANRLPSMNFYRGSIHKSLTMTHCCGFWNMESFIKAAQTVVLQPCNTSEIKISCSKNKSGLSLLLPSLAFHATNALFFSQLSQNTIFLNPMSAIEAVETPSRIYSKTSGVSWISNATVETDPPQLKNMRII